MNITCVPAPISRCRFGFARCDITPPVGIYHRFWGAAEHDRASGVHRPLTASVFILQPAAAKSADLHVFVAIDHCLFRPPEMDEVLEAVSRRIGVETERITFAFSHTHSGGNICRGRAELPGGELIGPYLDSLPERISESFAAARKDLRAAVLTYGSATCGMGHNRDYWDAERRQFVCGFNPDDTTELPVQIVRVTREDGGLLATIVGYPCHATTLAWQNSLISPDYVGALRETVEQATGAPCVFLAAPSGDIGPRDGFAGDAAVADRNGRQVAYAALSGLESLPPVMTDFHYVGPVLSGATLGAWEHRPLSPEREMQTAMFRRRRWEVPLPYRADLPTVAAAEEELATRLAQEAAARGANDLEQAQRFRALAERTRRLLERIRPLPSGESYPFPLALWQIGDAFWAAIEGEPYFALQAELTRRFPDHPLVLIPLANGARCSYLPSRTAYDKPLYQVEVALLAAGCLETITEEVAAQIVKWLSEGRGTERVASDAAKW